MSASVRPARASALAAAGTGPMPIVGGRNAGHRPGTSRASGRRPELGGLLRGGDQTRGGTVVLAAGVAGGHRGLRVLLAAAPGAAWRGLQRGVRARVLVGLDDGLSLLRTVPGRSRPRSGRPAWAATARWCERTAARPAPRAGCAYSRRRFSAVSSIPAGHRVIAPPAVTRPRSSRSCSVTSAAPRAPADAVE